MSKRSSDDFDHDDTDELPVLLDTAIVGKVARFFNSLLEDIDIISAIDTAL